MTCRIGRDLSERNRFVPFGFELTGAHDPVQSFAFVTEIDIGVQSLESLHPSSECMAEIAVCHEVVGERSVRHAAQHFLCLGTLV